MAFGGTIVPRLNLIVDLICREYFTDRSLHDPNFHIMPVMLGDENKQCRVPEVQALVSKFTLYGGLIQGILSAMVSPKLGALSDRYGRLPMISYTILGVLINEIVVICVAMYPDVISVNWILAGYMFDGLAGTFIAAMTISYAYASDCTPPEERNVAFGYYHGALFGGIALGPILAGYIVKRTGKILTVFYIALALHTAFFLFIVLVVPESLTKERQLRARETKKHLIGHGEQASQNWSSYTIKLLKGGNLLAPLTILWPTGEGTNPSVRRNLALIAAVDTTMFGVAMGAMTVTVLYSGYMFNWGTFQTSIFVSIVNICRVITLLVLLPSITRVLRGPRSKTVTRNSGSDNIDLGIIRAAIFFDTLGYVGYAVVRTGPLFILCGAAAAVGGMGSPTLQAAITKHVPPDRIGQVLGAMGLLHAAARVIAPTIFNLIYASTVGKFSQTVFVCLAATFGVAFVMSWFIRPHGMPKSLPHCICGRTMLTKAPQYTGTNPTNHQDLAMMHIFTKPEMRSKRL